MTTIKHLLQAHGTLDQYEIMQRADVLFRSSCGRYNGGPLTDAQIDYLTPKKVEHATKKTTAATDAVHASGTARPGDAQHRRHG